MANAEKSYRPFDRVAQLTAIAPIRKLALMGNVEILAIVDPTHSVSSRDIEQRVRVMKATKEIQTLPVARSVVEVIPNVTLIRHASIQIA
jgi:hypothetical protein